MKYIVTYDENKITEILIDDLIKLNFKECYTIIKVLKKFMDSNVSLELGEDNKEGLTQASLYFNFNDELFEVKIFQDYADILIQIIASDSIWSDIIPYTEFLNFIDVIQSN